MDTLSSREDLLQRIEQLEAENRRLRTCSQTPDGDGLSFRERYATRILDRLPDMLSVLSPEGKLIAVVSSEETNHVGQPLGQMVGKNIGEFLSPDAYRNITENIDRVMETGRQRTAHHDITLDGTTRHYENRIFPLDDRLLLCMCRDVTEELETQEEVDQALRRMAKAEEIASLSHWYYYEKEDTFEAPGIIPRLSGMHDPLMTRCSRSDLMAHVHPSDRKRLEAQFEVGAPVDGYVEYRIVLDGRMRYLHSRIIHTHSEEGYRIIEGYAQDMTYMVERLHELEAVKYALSNAVEEIFACNLDGTIEFANRPFRLHNKLYGDLTRRHIYEFGPLSSNESDWKRRIHDIRSGKGRHKFTLRYNDTDGKQASVEVVSYIIFDSSREKELVWFFSRDISQRVAYEEKLRELNILMNTILNNIPVYLFVKDPGNEFRYLYWNKAFEEHSGIPASRALDHTDYEIFPAAKDAEKFRRDDLDLLRSGERIEFQEEYTAVGGKQRIVTTSKALVPVENRLPLIIGISWDITELKRTERELIAARIKAEESDRLKSAFLANMSHEIRTPLNAIVGFSKLIGEADSEEEKQQFTDIIDSNSELLLQLINDILDISKIEAGTLEFPIAPMSLGDLCRTQFEVHKGRTKPDVVLRFEPPAEEVTILSSQSRLAQVITNLLNNAIKFTDQGEIRFGYEVKGEHIHFHVTDTGSGIPADKLPSVFQRFVKLNRFVAGSGLGLAITKMIVERLNGTIDVESTEGVGTTFHFTIPIRYEEEPMHGAS